jgi:putative flippase GtrA
MRLGKYQSILKISSKYFLISGSLVFLSYLLNILLIIKFKININIAFIFCFILFAYLSYFFNTKLNFKRKTQFQDFIKYFQNTLFTFFTSLMIINFLDYFFMVGEIYLITIAIIYSSILNFILNLKIVYKYKF